MLEERWRPDVAESLGLSFNVVENERADESRPDAIKKRPDDPFSGLLVFLSRKKGNRSK